MNKTVTITIQGMVFTVEEDAYSELNAYLEAIKKQFGSSEESKEVLQEIESRIAELFVEEIVKEREVITLSDIEQLKSIMGEVHDFVDDEEVKQTATYEKKKRFYRNGDDKVIAGVASGIAAYLGIEPVIVRVLLVIGLITGVLSGFVIILYLLVWWITEEADTLTEKMEMEGEVVTLQSIQNRVKSTVQAGKELVEEKMQGKEGKKKSSKIKKGVNRLFQLFGQLFWGLVSLLKKFGKVFGKIIGVVFLIGGVFFMTVVSFTLGVVAFYPDSPLVDFPFEVLGSSTEYYLLIISASLIAFIPLLFLVLLGIRLIKKKFVFPLYILVMMLFLWGASIATTGVLAVKTAPEIQQVLNGDEVLTEISDYEQIEKEQLVDVFDRLLVHNDYSVTVEEGEEFSVKLAGSKKDVERTLVQVESERLIVQRDGRFFFCLFCIQRPVDVIVTIPSTLSSIQTTGAATVLIADLNQSTLSLTSSGASKIDMQGVVEEIMLRQSGASQIVLSGEGRVVNGQLSGATELGGGEFIVNQMRLEMSGASDATVHVETYLEVDNSGASELSYKGDPELLQSLSGAATIQQLLFEKNTDNEVIE